RVAYPAARTIAFTTTRREGRSRSPGECAAFFGSGSLVPGSEVLRLLVGQGVDLDAQRRELEPRDLGVDLARHRVDVALQAGRVVDHVLGGERLVGEGHVHHGRGMTLGRREVDEASLRDQEEALPILELELLDELTGFPRLGRELAQRRDLDL